MNTIESTQRDDLARPANLTELGAAVWQVIVELLKKDGNTYTGGCKAFYSPAEWQARGEKYGHGSVLVICHNGGEVARYFDYDHEDYEAIERLNEALRALGVYAEACTVWYSAIYLI